MSHIEKAIEELENKIQQKQKELEELQITVNNLCKLLNPNASPRYEIKGQSVKIPLAKLKGDEYFRRPTATALTLILKARKEKDMGPATIEEIQEKMLKGGYVFEVKDPKISIGTALGKNPKFTKVGEKWGLTEWYPTANETPKKRGRPRKKPQGPKQTINEQTEGTVENEK